MRFQPTVFGELMKAVSRPDFRAAIAGRAKWGLSDWAHLVMLVAAQVGGARSLRELVALAAHHRAALVHLGVDGVSRSTLSDAKALRPTAPFEAVAARLSADVAQLSRGLGQEALRLIDATRMHAGKQVRHWAADGAVKLHVVYHPQADRTTCFAVSSARVSDISAAKHFPIEPGASYVFDRGYCDFGFWAKLAAAGCRFVTRLKANTPVRVLRKRRRSKATPHILANRTALLPQRLAASRQNPFSAAVRLIDVRIDNGHVLTLVSNDLTAPASDLAALYKSRWEVELFFQWIKQNLRLQRFIGTSKNAITLQILAALIAILLVRLAQLRANSGLAAQAAFRIIGIAFLQRRPIELLPHPPRPPDTPAQTTQTAFHFAYA
jgi:hypothetical protein